MPIITATLLTLAGMAVAEKAVKKGTSLAIKELSTDPEEGKLRAAYFEHGWSIGEAVAGGDPSAPLRSGIRLGYSIAEYEEKQLQRTR